MAIVLHHQKFRFLKAGAALPGPRVVAGMRAALDSAGQELLELALQGRFDAPAIPELERRHLRSLDLDALWADDQTADAIAMHHSGALRGMLLDWMRVLWGVAAERVETGTPFGDMMRGLEERLDALDVIDDLGLFHGWQKGDEYYRWVAVTLRERDACCEDAGIPSDRPDAHATFLVVRFFRKVVEACWREGMQKPGWVAGDARSGVSEVGWAFRDLGLAAAAVPVDQPVRPVVAWSLERVRARLDGDRSRPSPPAWIAELPRAAGAGLAVRPG